MAKRSRLISALDSQKNRNFKVEKQKLLAKKAAKLRRKTSVNQTAGAADEIKLSQKDDHDTGDDRGSEGWEIEDVSMKAVSEDIQKSEAHANGGTINSHHNESDEEPTGDNSMDEADEIPLSDLESVSSSQKEDIVPHQRLLINNTSALLKAYHSICLSTTLSFSAHQTVVTTEQVSIPDVHDDLTRELAFYKQSLDAATEARALLRKEHVPFSRPIDYFAEMVKSDEHMSKIKAKMTEEAANKKASAEARKQRDLKKFGKQVQVAKLQERDRSKRDTLDKIKVLKRKRKDGAVENAKEEDMFDVALEDAATSSKRSRETRGGPVAEKGGKRRKRDEKFGFGGKKRFSKSGDAVSSGDLRDFSAKKMKGMTKGAQRLGKSRRAKQ